MTSRFRPIAFAFALAILAGTGAADAGESTEPVAPPVAHAPVSQLPWLGVTMDGGGDTGVRIERVVRGSPAERSGLRVGDRIVAIDGARVTAPAQVSGTVARRRVGDTVKLNLERTGSPLDASIVLAARPSGDEILKMDLVGAPAPAWSNVTALSGAPSSLAQLKGRVVLVDFWASWCGPCRLLAPKLSALKDRFAAQGLTVVGITTDEAEGAAIFAEKHRMRYGIVVDKEGETNRAYGITSLPTVLLIDKKGVVREAMVGFDPTPSGDARLEAAVKKLLAESGPPPSPVVRSPSVPRPDGR